MFRAVAGPLDGPAEAARGSLRLSITITAPGGSEKLRFLRERGVTRLSFGVQSFDDTVLKYAARGYKRDIPLRACAIAADVFENWNLDLIQGDRKSVV